MSTPNEVLSNLADRLEANKPQLEVVQDGFTQKRNTVHKAYHDQLKAIQSAVDAEFDSLFNNLKTVQKNGHVRTDFMLSEVTKYLDEMELAHKMAQYVTNQFVDLTDEQTKPREF